MFCGLSSLSAVQHLAKGLWPFWRVKLARCCAALSERPHGLFGGVWGKSPTKPDLQLLATQGWLLPVTSKKADTPRGGVFAPPLYKHERCHAKYYPNITQLRALLSQINRLKFRPRLEGKIIPRPLYRKPRCRTK